MPLDTIVYSTYNNEKFQLIFNQSIVLLEKNSPLEFFLPKEHYGWKFEFFFVKEIPQGQSAFSTTTDFIGKTIRKTFYGWEGDDWIEFTTPQLIQPKDINTVKLYLKVRSLAPFSRDFRTVEISIWKTPI